MKKYLLDTSVVAGYLLARSKAKQLVRPLLVREGAVTSILVYGEVAEYVKKFADFRAYKASLETLLEHIYPYPLTYAILERYADIRRQLRPRHEDIGDIDTLIVRRDTQTYIPQQLGKNLKGGSWATHLTWN